MPRFRMSAAGMTCDACNRHVEQALHEAGARQARARWRQGEAHFSLAEGADLRDVAAAASRAGYEPGDVEALDDVAVAVPVGDRGDYDLVIVGGGSAAFAAAIRATNLGARVAIVERGTVGGTCVNVGCIPSKHLLAAAHVYHQAGRHPFAGAGTAQEGVDMGALVDAKAAVVGPLRKEKYEDLAGRYGFDLIGGHARFTSAEEVEVAGCRITAGRFLIATGSAPWIPPIEGIKDAGYLTSTTAMALRRVPRSVVVIGGNYVGLEMAQMFADLGSTVTILEALPRIAPEEEPEVSRWMQRILSERGIEVATGADAVRVETGERKGVIALVEGTERRFEADEVLVATGRRPLLEGLDLNRAGIAVDQRGRLDLDGELRTTNHRVFAAGDVTGAPQFVYVAAAQGTLAADNALADAGRTMDYRALPRVTFTTPNIAAVGLTEVEAQRAGMDVESRVLELEHVPRARVNLETRGACKIVAEQERGTVVGIHLVAPDAGDVLLGAVYAVKFGLTVQDLADTWAPYLTMGEAVKLTAQTFTADVSKLSCCAA